MWRNPKESPTETKLGVEEGITRIIERLRAGIEELKDTQPAQQNAPKDEARNFVEWLTQEGIARNVIEGQHIKVFVND